jgi:hypothetical protein
MSIEDIKPFEAASGPMVFERPTNMTAVEVGRTICQCNSTKSHGLKFPDLATVLSNENSLAFQPLEFQNGAS